MGSSRRSFRIDNLLKWLIFGSLLGTVILGLSFYTHPSHASPAVQNDSVRYGPDAAKVQAAIGASGWPQQQNNYCGVATISAVAAYVGSPTSQAAVAGYLDAPAAQSAWGTPGKDPAYYGPGFVADISRDLGTDPRSLAAGLTHFGGAQYRQVVALNGAYDSTAHLVNDLVSSGVPISVIVDHGQHSVVVSGVYANANPVNNLNSVTAIEVWDPGANSPFGGIQAAQMVTVSLNTWLYDAHYWGAVYNANYDSSSGKWLDPDPAVGPYNVGQNPRARLWIDHYVYFRQSGAATPDWAFTQSGALILGLDGQPPAGYGGATVPMPVLPPPPPPTATPLPTATPRPTATPLPTATPEPTATPLPTATPRPAATPAGTDVRSTMSGIWKGVCRFDWCGAVDPLWALLAIIGAVAIGVALAAVAAVHLRRRRRKQAGTGGAPPDERELVPAGIAAVPDVTTSGEAATAGEASGEMTTPPA